MSTRDGADSMNGEVEGGDCMSNADMLMLTLSSHSASQRTIEHLLSCDRCNGRLASVRRVVADIVAKTGVAPETAGPGPSCLSEVALARLIDADVAAPATREEVAHLLGCPHCRSELVSLAALVGDPGVGDEIEKLETKDAARRKRTPRLRYAFPPKLVSALAAAAVLLLVARVATTRRETGIDTTVHRAPTIAALETPRSLLPIGDVDAARHFTWSAVPGSDRYRLTLYDDSAHVLYEIQVRDTMLALPDSVVLVRGVPYVWQVEARTAIDRWTSSETAEFVVGARRAPR